MQNILNIGFLNSLNVLSDKYFSRVLMCANLLSIDSLTEIHMMSAKVCVVTFSIPVCLKKKEQTTTHVIFSRTITRHRISVMLFIKL